MGGLEHAHQIVERPERLFTDVVFNDGISGWINRPLARQEQHIAETDGLTERRTIWPV